MSVNTFLLPLFACCSSLFPGGSVGCGSGLSGYHYHVNHHPHCCVEEGKTPSFEALFFLVLKLTKI